MIRGLLISMVSRQPKNHIYFFYNICEVTSSIINLKTKICHPRGNEVTEGSPGRMDQRFWEILRFAQE